MTKLVDITDRLEEKRRGRQVHLHREKLEAIKRIAYCSSCRLRCALCGCTLDGLKEGALPNLASPHLNLCESCRSDFEDFLDTVSRQKSPQLPWHNEQWKKLWSAWLEYQRAVREFRNSSEVKRLMQEIDIPRDRR